MISRIFGHRMRLNKKQWVDVKTNIKYPLVKEVCGNGKNEDSEKLMIRFGKYYG